MYDSETSLLKNGTPLKFCDKQTEKEILWTPKWYPKNWIQTHTEKDF